MSYQHREVYADEGYQGIQPVITQDGQQGWYKQAGRFFEASCDGSGKWIKGSEIENPEASELPEGDISTLFK
jgi:hypothetical protein